MLLEAAILYLNKLLKTKKNNNVKYIKSKKCMKKKNKYIFYSNK